MVVFRGPYGRLGGPAAACLAVLALLSAFATAFAQEAALPAGGGAPRAELVLSSPADGERIRRRVAVVSGRVGGVRASDARALVEVRGAGAGLVENYPFRPAADGTFRRYVVLFPGRNSVTVSCFLPDGSVAASSVEVVCSPPGAGDTEEPPRPSLVLDEPPEGRVEAGWIRVSGRIENGASRIPWVVLRVVGDGGKTVLERRMRVGSGGAFSASVKLEPGVWLLEVSAAGTTLGRRLECGSSPAGGRGRERDEGGAPGAEDGGGGSEVGITLPFMDEVLVQDPLLVFDAAVYPVPARFELTGAASGAGGDAVVRVRRLSPGLYRCYVVLYAPSTSLLFSAWDADETLASRRMLQVWCTRPVGWSGPLPPELRARLERRASEGNRPGGGRPGEGGGLRGGSITRVEKESVAHVEAPPVSADEGDEWTTLDVVLVALLPICGVLAFASLGRIRKRLERLALSLFPALRRRTLEEPCSVCRRPARDQYLFSLSAAMEAEKGHIASLVEACRMMDTDEINERMSSLLDELLRDLEHDGGGDPAYMVRCVWCKSCKSAFLTVEREDAGGESQGAGDGLTGRYPVMNEVFHDWLVVKFGL